MTRENFSLLIFTSLFFFFWNNLIVCFLRVSFSSHRWYRIFFRLCKSNIRSFYPYRSIYCEYFSLEILFPIFLSSFFFSISSFIHPRFLIYLFLFRQNFKSNKDKNYIDSRRGNFHISRKKHDYSLYGRSILQDDDVSESVEQPTINYNGVLGRRGAPSLWVLHT